MPSRQLQMVSPIINRSKLPGAILGIAVVAFLVLVSSFLKVNFFEENHDAVMLGSFSLVVVLCIFLLSEARQIIHLQGDRIDGLMGIKLALASLIDLKDSYTEGHSRNVRNLVRHFVEYLKWSAGEIEEITGAAELHDIEKIGVPDSILKKNGPLDEKEFYEIKKHPARGADAIQSLKSFDHIAKIIRHHHERYDGTGYPDGLSAQQIPLASRILAIVDAYDAMVHRRSYRGAMASQEVLNTLEHETGTHFDPVLLSAFIKFMEQNVQESFHDLVCGMAVDPKNSSFKHIYQNQTYIFCSEVCAQKFMRSPEKYIGDSWANEPSPTPKIPC